MTVKICMLAITALSLAVLVRQWKSDFLPLLRLGAVILFSALLLSASAPIVAYLRDLIEGTTAASYAVILFKALGIAFLSQCCSEICKECGENGISTGVELIGKVEILLLCLPMINDILTLTRELLSIGS